MGVQPPAICFGARGADSALTIDPNNREATDLQNTISSQMRLEQNKVAPPDMPTPPPAANGVERRLLTNNDINIIRQKELQSGDHVSVALITMSKSAS